MEDFLAREQELLGNEFVTGRELVEDGMKDTEPEMEPEMESEPEPEPLHHEAQDTTLDLDSTDALREWREKQAERIEKIDKESTRKRAEMKKQAEQSIDTFYLQYNEKKMQSIKRNGEAEQKAQDVRLKALSQGTVWDRVANLIDSDSRKDELQRYKQVLGYLRAQGEAAPGAAGY